MRLLQIAPENTSDLPLITDDRVIFGILLGLIAFIFWAASKKGLTKFFRFAPAVLLCYFIPSLLAMFGLFSPEHSALYDTAKNFCLPAALILFTMNINIPGLLKLGPKALVIFLTGTIGIILGGPLAVWLVSLFDPVSVGGEGTQAAWRGFATLAGSWIGGSPNQTALLEVYKFDQTSYAGMVAIDIVVANLLMAFLLAGAGFRKRIDKWLRADTRSVDALMKQASDELDTRSGTADDSSRKNNFIYIIGLTFGGVALAHFAGNTMSGYFSEKYTALYATEANPTPNLDEFVLCGQFFWVVLTATLIGLAISFTRAKNLSASSDNVGKIGSLMMYFLIATIGMKMDITAALDNPVWLIVGLIWILFHLVLLFLVARLIRAPFFFVAVGSMANVGGAATAPVVAEAFHGSLMPVGVLLAVLGYCIGTFGGMLSAELMFLVAP